MHTTAIILLLVLTPVFFPSAAAAQDGTSPFPRPADVQSLDGIIRAFYDVVSGPAGQAPDRARDESLHFPNARIGISGFRSDGTPALFTMSLERYHERFGGPRDTPFFEWEIHRETQRFGSIAHVWSTYVTSDAPNGVPTGRGITSMQLYFDGTRWWITGWNDERERAENPIPRQFLPAGEE